MGRDEAAENEFKGIGEGRSWSHVERDLPANQLFQNLELLIKERMKGWERRSFEEKVRIEMELTTYKENVRMWARANGAHMPNLEIVDVEYFNRLEGINAREKITESIRESKTYIQRMQRGAEYAKILYGAYGELIFYDKRTNSDLRSNLLATLKPTVINEFMRVVRSKGGFESSGGMDYLLSEPRSMESDVKPMLSSSGQGYEKYKTVLVSVNAQLIETYIRRYYMLEIIFKLILSKIEEENHNLQSLEMSLNLSGGHVTPAERQSMDTFVSGRNPDYNIGRHLADLDIARIEGERYLTQKKKW